MHKARHHYSYSLDGRLKLSTDNRDATLDRAYKYDQVGRLVEAFTASEARSWVQTGDMGTTEDGPYRQSYTLDPWDNMGTKWGRSFTGTHRRTQTVIRYYNALTGRVNGWGYDNAGNITSGDYVMNAYDAAGRLRQSDGNDTVLGKFDYDGDGVKTKSQIEAAHIFLLRSSVLGEKLAEIQTSDGTRWNGFVFADGELIATQSMGLIDWQHRDPSQRSTRTTDANQEGVGHDELDPNGVKVDVPGVNHYNHGTGGGHILGSGGIAARVASLMDIKTCVFYEMAVPCSMVEQYQNSINEMPGEWQLFWAHGLWFSRDYVPSRVTTLVAAGKIDPILLGMFLNKLITTEEFGELLKSGFMPLAFTQDKKKPKKRLQSKLPRNPQPITVKYMNQKYVNDFLKALQEAEKRLQEGDCAKLFGKSSADLVNMLENTEYRVLTLASGGPKYDSVTGIVSVTGAQTNSPTSVFINGKGPFFNQTPFVPGKGTTTLDFGSNLRGAQFGALLLLHELGHQTGIFAPDAGNDELNRKYTRRVQEACF